MSRDAQHNDYRRKVKTRDELRAAIGPRPRAKTVIMCHGTFDLVHPGHIRHLMYAKDKADLLIASLTSDSHIDKANFRPFVPQNLRAMNLAALEIVDYVVVDDNPTPTFSVKYERQVDFSGGAAVVAKHMRKAGAEVVFSTVMGEDACKDMVLADLKAEGIQCEPVVDPTRPTTQKNAFITNGYRMLK